MEQPRWTLDELAERVDAALAVDYGGQPSGRVRDVPDRRAIRWYTTIGLIDRPVAHRGRTALYGTRHLLQLVAVKRLQARGLPLVAIQRELAGATDAQLARVARLPATPVPVVRTAATAEGAPPKQSPARPAKPSATAATALTATRRAGFWREPPSAALVTGDAPTASPEGDGPDEEGAPTPSASGPDELGTPDPPEGSTFLGMEAPDPPRDSTFPGTEAPDPRDGVATLRGVRLGDGATLLLEPRRELGVADLRAILDAARPLLATLRARGLAAGTGGPDPGPRRTGRPEPRREHP
jgi:hypothetical protein